MTIKQLSLDKSKLRKALVLLTSILTVGSEYDLDEGLVSDVRCGVDELQHVG